MSSQSPAETTKASASPASAPSPANSSEHKPTGEPGEKRVPLACHRCRAKRARCSGEKPVCKACSKAEEECMWPSGRKRKRTRREMEEEERKERAATAAANAPNQGHIPYKIFPDGGSTSTPVPWGASLEPPSWGVSPPSNGLSYIWPPPHSTPADSAGESSPTLLTAPFGSERAPHDTSQLVRSLQSQVAFIDGDPSLQEDLELYYYRFSGSTAIHPGINRISLKLQPRTAASPASAPVPSPESLPTPPRQTEMFDDSGLPLPNIYIPLLDTFFRTMSRHFPSISRKRMEERLETGTCPRFSSICQVTFQVHRNGYFLTLFRFQPSGEFSPAKACTPFVTKAQELIIPLLHLPTTDCVTGLLLLAWANYGQNSESGLWQYSGMAIRMALDLGLHEISEIYESEAHMVRTRLLFWSLFMTDRILAFSNGRPPSISEEIIEIPLPCDEDFVPDPARTNDPAAANEQPQPTPFVHLVRLMVLCGRIASVLNGRRGRLRTLVGPTTSSPEVLRGLQTQLVQFYADLPEPMKWSVEAFKHQEARGYGGSFLTLHLWANGIMALVYHTELLTSPSGTETPLSQNMDRSIKLSIASSRTISECLVFGDLFASHSYLSSPFTVQPIYIASLAFIHDIKFSAMDVHLSEKPRNVDVLLTSMARQNLSVMMKALARMEHLWAGVSYVTSILESRAEGLGQFRIDPSPRSKKTFISLPDKGLLRRFTGSDLPHNTAPPTDTSLRQSIAKEAETRTCSLDELLSSYSIAEYFVQPADSFDLESMLSSSGFQNGHENIDGGT
ncbi:fungal-specific transcription factor domain-containing protein [Mycena rosella]|uniref:Fungal-specific transcription factor domain-containing protein n=1 Tax=Mycena rosella TaxID=1033263 RepID=A0AAD7D2D2_MYCRO|nr:fungal-specific transcription factor domain-containing protein [Mycena rosella]